MDVYIARQPIFNVHRKLFAYELLYRGTPEASLAKVNGERATTSLLSSAFLTEGVEVISESRPCFINFTEDLLLKQIPLSFPKNKVVVEVLENVRPTKPVIEACRILVNHGYTLALDDFVYYKALDPLIELAQIIKIDFRLTPVDTIHKTLYHLQRFNLKLLAEKIETVEEFTKAFKLGFHYFQGYFFSRPESIRIKELSAAKVNMLRLLVEMSQKTTTLEELQKIISVDISISYKLLRFLNSAYFYRLEKVKTVRQAIAYLGEKELRRFIMLVIISELSSDKPNELVRMALVRAKFCELLGESSIIVFDSAELFLLGMFSLIDVMLDSPMGQILDKLPFTATVKDALSGHGGDYVAFLDIMNYYERNQASKLDGAFMGIGVDLARVPELYLQSLKYANSLL
jgi:EAL and modified HD-GYP domain-containing signal transduction protein